MSTNYLPYGKDLHGGNSTVLVTTDDVTHMEDDVSKKLWIYAAPLLLFIGTVGSVLSFLVLCQKSLRLQTTMFYLAVLAVADVTVLYSGLLRLWLENRMDVYIRLHSGLMCKLHTAFVYVCLDMSVWVTVAVSVDRCIFVSSPHKAKQWCTMARARWVIGLLLLMTSLVNCHFLWTYDIEKIQTSSILGNSEYRCYTVRNSEITKKFIESVWPWIDFSKYFLIPFIIMSVTTCIIVRQLIRSDALMAKHRQASLTPKIGAVQPLEEHDEKISPGCVVGNGRRGSGVPIEEEVDNVVEKHYDMSKIDCGVGSSMKSETTSQETFVSRRMINSKTYKNENQESEIPVIDMSCSKMAIQGHGKVLKPSVNKLQIIERSPEVSSELTTIQLEENSWENDGLSILDKSQINTSEAFGKAPNIKTRRSKNVLVLSKIRKHAKVAPLSADSSEEVNDVDLNSNDQQAVSLSKTILSSFVTLRQKIISETKTCEVTNTFSNNSLAQPTLKDPEFPPDDGQSNLGHHEYASSQHKDANDIHRPECETQTIAMRCERPASYRNISTVSEDLNCKKENLLSTDFENNSSLNQCKNPSTHSSIKDLSDVQNLSMVKSESNQDRALVCVKVEKDRNSLSPESDFVSCIGKRQHDGVSSDVCSDEIPLVQTSNLTFNSVENKPIRDVKHVSRGQNGDCTGKLENNEKANTVSFHSHVADWQHRSFTMNSKDKQENKVNIISESGTDRNENCTTFKINSDKSIIINRMSHQVQQRGDNSSEVNLNIATSRHNSLQKTLKKNVTHNLTFSTNHQSNTNRDVNTDVTTRTTNTKTPTNKERRRTISTSSTTKLVTNVTSKLSTRGVYVSVTLVTMNIVFCLLNAPIMVFIIGLTYWTQRASDTQVARLRLGWTVVNLLQYTNCAGHFFLYCLTGPKFRLVLGQIFSSLLRRLKSCCRFYKTSS